MCKRAKEKVAVRYAMLKLTVDRTGRRCFGRSTPHVFLLGEFSSPLWRR